MKNKPILFCLISWCICWCLSLNAQPGGSYDIYTINLRTGAIQQVTALPGSDEYNPSFSNSGHDIVHDVVVASPPAHDLYITQVGSGISTALTGGEGGNDAAWSPNGNLIAFDRIPAGDVSIYTVPASGGTRTLVRTSAYDADWSPNGKYLVFTDASDGSVRTKHILTGVETTVALFGVNPTWSRNGSSIAYSDMHNLFLIPVNHFGQPTGSPVQLTFDGPSVFNQQPSWSNNSRTLVFHSNRGGADFDIWTIPVSGGPPSLLTGVPGTGDFDPDYSNRRYVAYAGWSPGPMARQVTPVIAGLGTQVAIQPSVYPNPFSRSATVHFRLTQQAYTRIAIHDMQGKQVALLVNAVLDEGAHEITWDPSGQFPGIYIVELSAGVYQYTGRLVFTD